MPKKFSLLPDENVVMEEKAMIRSGKISAHAGKLILTNQRLVFAKKPNPFHGILGGLGGWLAGKSQDLLPLDTPLSDITDVERTKFGRCDKVLLVRTSSQECQIILSKTIDQWIQAIRTAPTSQH